MDSAVRALVDEKVWFPFTDPNGKQLYACLACNDGRLFEKKNRGSHEKGANHRHKASIRELRKKRPLVVPKESTRPDRDILLNATRHLVHSLAHRPGTRGEHAPLDAPPAPIPPGWNLEDELLPMYTTREEEALIQAREKAAAIEEFILCASDDEDEGDISDTSDGEGGLGGMFGMGEIDPNYSGPRKRRRFEDLSILHPESEWYPWPDKITASLDVLMHLPRSVFSQRQLDLFLWLLRVNSVDDVPSVSQLVDYSRHLQSLCGIDSIPYTGSLGHKYFVNSLGQILAQEMANPRVRKDMSFYPEDAGDTLSEARQGQRWLHELPPELTTPYANINGKAYFTFEPSLARVGQETRIVIPVRWFKKDEVLHAQCWDLEVSNDGGGSRWRAVVPDLPHHVRILGQADFLKPFPEVKHDIELHPEYYLRLYGVIPTELKVSGPKARVLSMPIWLYCDDTSGNLSKKWNAHNSFLFSLAGLPRSEAAKEYNVHFLSTSNIAPPLEMAEGILEQVKTAQQEGIWTWDVEANEAVLVFPVVLALLGDNPMQSEMASHIGLRGKLFCRVCDVEGARWSRRAARTSLDDDGLSDIDDDDDVEDIETASASGSRAPSPTPSIGSQIGSSHPKYQWSVPGIVDRLSAFVRPGKPRTVVQTLKILNGYYEDARVIGNKERIKKKKTATGVKDTFQQHFLDQLFDCYKNRRTDHTRQAALDAQLASMDKPAEEMINPILRVHGLDPHCDTPVEILHVVLLGFIKYFWKDAIQNQMKNKEAKKELLAARLSSFDVSGLGISPLAGHTLVRYAGSLVGRDFRAIAQVAPFVLKEFVSEDCFEAWKCLSKLVPLIWQPQIQNLPVYIETLQYEIDQFLIRTARWTGAWFNKPKFHVLVHLPDHIQRFGPAILFATEVFESFNAVIRAKSVHSNRQAPSRDISRAFAQGNRLRHLASGGHFQIVTADEVQRTSRGASIDVSSRTFSHDPRHWKSAGPGIQALLALDDAVATYLGLGTKAINWGCTRHPEMPDAVPYSGLKIASAFPESSEPLIHGRLFWRCSSCVLDGGDRCGIEDFVVASDADGLLIGQVEEIVQQYDGCSPQADAILLREYDSVCQWGPRSLDWLRFIEGKAKPKWTFIEDGPRPSGAPDISKMAGMSMPGYGAADHGQPALSTPSNAPINATRRTTAMLTRPPAPSMYGSSRHNLSSAPSLDPQTPLHQHHPGMGETFDDFSSPSQAAFGSTQVITNTPSSSSSGFSQRRAQTPLGVLISPDVRNHVVQLFSLTEESQDELEDFQDLMQLIPGMDKAVAVPFFFILSALFRLQDQVAAQLGSVPDVRQMRETFEKLTQLVDKDRRLVLSTQQMKNIRICTNNGSFDKSLYETDTLSQRVFDFLQKNQVTWKFEEAFSTAANQVDLQSILSDTASSVMGSVRLELIASVCHEGGKQLSLAQLVRDWHKKYTKGAKTAIVLERGHIVRVALMRAFVLDRREFIKVPGKAAGKRVLQELYEREDPTVLTSPSGEKVPVPAMPANGYFWSTWDWWMECCKIEYGNDLNTNEFKEFINKVIADDVRMFVHPETDPCPAVMEVMDLTLAALGTRSSSSGNSERPDTPAEQRMEEDSLGGGGGGGEELNPPRRRARSTFSGGI